MMPRTKRKGQTTSKKTKPVKRLSKTTKSPSKPKAVKLTAAKNDEQKKANYYDLVNRPNDSIRSKTTGNFISAAKPPRNLKIPQDWDVSPGDVISWSQGRPTETFFVTNEGKLLKNPDTSGSGYLTIPLAITSQYPDALDYFSAVLDGVGRNYVASVELAPTDAFFASNFSKQVLPATVQKRNDISYSFDPNEEVLFVSHASNPSQAQNFSLTAKLNDIVQWISAGNETKAKILVKYDFQGKENCSKAPRGIINGLPAGWICEQQGSASYGQDKIQGEWKCEGPEKTKEKARKAIEKFYKGLKNIEIN